MDPPRIELIAFFRKSSDGGSKVFDGKGGLIYVLNVWFYLDFDYHDINCF
jgi:hypothetical protein